MTNELEDKIKLELERAKIEEFDVISVDKEWWIQIYFLEEEDIAYLEKTFKVLDDMCFGSLRNHDCKVSIREDKNVFYILGKFSPRTWSYNYNPGAYSYSSGSSAKNSPSSNAWQTAKPTTPSYPSTSGFSQEEEEDWERSTFDSSSSSKFIVSKEKRQEILYASRVVPMTEAELSHMTRIISDRMYSEETPSLKGPNQLPGNTGSRYWTTSSKTITIYKITAPININTRTIVPVTTSTPYYTCYVVDVLHKSTKKEVSYFLTTFNDLRKMEFY